MYFVGLMETDKASHRFSKNFADASNDRPLSSLSPWED
jgi:hypothetical protein